MDEKFIFRSKQEAEEWKEEFLAKVEAQVNNFIFMGYLFARHYGIDNTYWLWNNVCNSKDIGPFVFYKFKRLPDEFYVPEYCNLVTRLGSKSVMLAQGQYHKDNDILILDECIITIGEPENHPNEVFNYAQVKKMYINVINSDDEAIDYDIVRYRIWGLLPAALWCTEELYIKTPSCALGAFIENILRGVLKLYPEGYEWQIKNIVRGAIKLQTKVTIALEGIENLNVSMISKVQEAYRHIPLSLKTYGGDIPVSNMYNVLSRDSECILNVGSILDVRILRLECLSI